MVTMLYCVCIICCGYGMVLVLWLCVGVDSAELTHGLLCQNFALFELTDPSMLTYVQASGNSQNGKQVDYTIVSEHYWPSIPREALTYHPTIATLLEAYQSTYAVLKKPRKLHPALQLGHVEVELEFDDGAVRCFTVTPMQVNSGCYCDFGIFGGVILTNYSFWCVFLF